MSSSDDSSSSSSDEAPPRNDRPSSHSGISDEEPSSPPPAAASAAKASTLSTKKASKKSVTPSSSSSSENEEEETPKKAKSRSKSSTPSSRSNSEAPTKRAAPIKSTDTMGSLSPDSSNAPEERHATPKIDNNEESNIVPDLSDSDVDDERRKKAKPVSSPKETNEDSDDDIVGPRLHFDPDDVEEEKEVEQPPIEYDVPLVRGNYGKEPPVLTRWPNFISVDRRPFTEDSYDPEEDINAVDSEGRSRLQLKVENCIRWRNKLDADGNIMKNEDGKEIRESNAKIVRWSDGTMTLNLGAEIYEITEHKIDEYNQLFLRMRAGLHGNAVFKKRFAFRPLTTDSMTHRKMTMQMAEKTNKSQKVKMLSEVGLDPESSRASLIRKEEERMRATMRREAQQRKAKERQYRTGLSHGFLEDRDDFDDDPESLSAIKRSYKNNRFDRFDAITRRYGQSEDEDEYEDSRRIERSKIESDDEEDANRKREEKKKRKIVISDEDED
jgi:RNA polymerase-associated protein LEO1